MRVKVSTEVPYKKHKVRRLERLLGRMMRIMDLGGNLELSVVLVGNERIQELNLKYLGKNEVTDVLAFPQLTKDELAEAVRARPACPEVLGDIAICLPAAREQAEEIGSREEAMLDLLAVHGLLHLIGYDDMTDKGAGEMQAMEIGLLGRNIYRKIEEE